MLVPSPAPAISPSFTARGGWSDPPCDWLLSELELRFKNQHVVTRRSRWHPSLKSWVNRWPLRSGQWPKNGQNATSPITSYLSRLEPRCKDQNVSYGLRNTMRCPLDPYGPFWGWKMFFSAKMVIFLWGILWPQWPHFDTWMPNGCQIQKQRTKLPLEHKNSKMT